MVFIVYNSDLHTLIDVFLFILGPTKLPGMDKKTSK